MTVEQTFFCNLCPLRLLRGRKTTAPPVRGELSAALSACEGVAAARVELPAGRAVVDHDLSPGDLEDLLDRRGLLMGEPIDK